MQHLGIMEHKQFEEAERNYGWREMKPGHWYYIGMETRGTNKWNKPITVVTVKLELGGPSIKFYAPPSLYYGLKSKPDTTAIRRLVPNTQVRRLTREKKLISLFFCHLKLHSEFYNG